MIRRSCSEDYNHKRVARRWKLGGVAALITCPVLCLALMQPAVPIDAPSPQEWSAASSAADPVKGRAVYEQYCQLCHGEGAKGYAADKANALASPEFLATASDDFLLHSMERGRPGTPMSAFGKRFGGPLGLGDLFHLLAYLRSLQTQPKVEVDELVVKGDPGAGALVYSKHCADCHGPDGKGKTAVGVTNPLFLGAVSDGFLRYAIEHGRTGTPMPAFGGKLSPREIDDVTRFLRSLTRTVKDDRPVGEVPRSFANLVLHPKGPAPSFTTLRDGRYLSVDEAHKAYAAGARMVILDARPTSDWLKAHIPGALPVPFYDSEKITQELPKDTWILTYCACPHAASDRVTDMLRSKGFEKTVVLDEGFFVWMERGYPTTYGSNSP